MDAKFNEENGIEESNDFKQGMLYERKKWIEIFLSSYNKDTNNFIFEPYLLDILSQEHRKTIIALESYPVKSNIYDQSS